MSSISPHQAALFAFPLIVSLLVACGGSGSRRKETFGEVARPDLSDVAVCSSEEKLNKEQVAAAEIMLARSGEVYEAKCLGKVEGDDERIRMHIVADIFEGALKSEQESWAWANRVSNGWEGERYGFVFDYTDAQSDTTGNASLETFVAQNATTEASRDATRAVADRTRQVVNSANTARLLKIENVEIRPISNSWDPDTNLPAFDIQATVANSDWGDVSYRVDVRIRLGDGSEVTYSSRPPCPVDALRANAALTETVAWVACPYQAQRRNIANWDELAQLANTATIIEACLVLNGDVLGPCYSP